MARTPYLSVIIPVYNERDNLGLLHAELNSTLGNLGVRYEVVYVNDGSRDGSDTALMEMAEKDERIVFVDLRRNFKKAAAITAGVDHAQGEVMVLMDADRQNDPADIGRVLAALEQGYDVVSGWRRKRKEPWLTRRLPSQTANALISWVTGVHLHDYGCMLKAYRREVIQEVRLYGEMHRFMPVFASAIGARITEIDVNDRPRTWGQSKYGLGRTFEVALDLITVKFLVSRRTTPMYLFGGLGMLLLLAGGLMLVGTIYGMLVSGTTAAPILTLLVSLSAILIVGGVQSIMLGLIAELLMRTYHESQGKPIYAVRQVIRGKSKTALR